MTWSQASRTAAETFYSVDAASILMSIDDHLPLMPRVSTVLISASSPISAVTMHETSKTGLKIVAEHRVNPVYQNLPTGYSPFNLLYPHLAALEVSVPHITLNFAPEDGPIVESVTAEVRGM